MNTVQQRDASIKSIDEFIAGYPTNTQIILRKIRVAIHSVNPDLAEKISYGIPTLTLNGKNVVHFSAYEHHIGFYPGAAPIAAFTEQLAMYKTSKGAVQFPIDKPLPVDLIKELTEYAIQRNRERTKK